MAPEWGSVAIHLPGVHSPQPPGQGCTARSHLARGAQPVATWPEAHGPQPPGQGCTARSHLARGAPPAATWPEVHHYAGCSHLLKDTPAAATWPAVCRPVLIWTLGHTSVFKTCGIMLLKICLFLDLCFLDLLFPDLQACYVLDMINSCLFVFWTCYILYLLYLICLHSKPALI